MESLNKQYEGKHLFMKESICTHEHEFLDVFLKNGEKRVRARVMWQRSILARIGSSYSLEIGLSMEYRKYK